MVFIRYKEQYMYFKIKGLYIFYLHVAINAIRITLNLNTIELSLKATPEAICNRVH